MNISAALYLSMTRYSIWNQIVTKSKFQKVNSYLGWAQFLRVPLKRFIVKIYIQMSMTKETWLIGVCVIQCLLCKPKMFMTSLCSTVAIDCRTGQNKGRYYKLLVLLAIDMQSGTVHENWNTTLNPLCMKSFEFRGSYSVTCLRIWMFWECA